MAINQNHLFEELNGIKCGIVEKNVKPERVQFLKDIWRTIILLLWIAPSPPPQGHNWMAAPAANEEQTATSLNFRHQLYLETFTIGVTDITFNPINAIFGGYFGQPMVMLIHWLTGKQKESVAHDDIPYL